MDEKKAVTMDQLLESARQGEALTMQVAQAAQEELNKRPTTEQVSAAITEKMDQQSVPVGKSLSGQVVKPDSGTIVTAGEGAEIFNDYKARTFSGTSVLEGNVASGKYSHAEGIGTTAGGEGSHAEGVVTTASHSYAHAEGFCTAAEAPSSHAEGKKTRASGSSRTLGEGSHAEGVETCAIGTGSHAEGTGTEATGEYSHAEGFETRATLECSHAEGERTVASSADAHAEGSKTVASGFVAHAEGIETTASGFYSHAGGSGTKAAGRAQTAIGMYNVESSAGTDKLIIGKGSSDTARANCFRVTDTGTYAAGSYNASGADYAELLEWVDGNPQGEDRAGRFVTLTGDKLRLASPGDDYIMGIVSGNPSIIGDVHDDQWAGMYLYDVFGRPLWEDVEVPDETVEEPDPEHPGQTVTRVIIPAHTEHRQKLNPAYDGSTPYTARTQRPEWDAVGLMGKLVAVDDGTCQADGYCTVGEGGGATESRERTRFRVMKRLDGNHVQVMVLA